MRFDMVREPSTSALRFEAQRTARCGVVKACASARSSAANRARDALACRSVSTGSHALGSSLPPGMRSRDRLFERGDTLGRYEVLFPLATGGRAAVYAARVRGEAR